MRNRSKLGFLVALAAASGLLSAGTINVDGADPGDPFPMHWKGVADMTLHLYNGWEAPRIESCMDSAWVDWNMVEDGAPFRLSLQAAYLRGVFPGVYPYTEDDWNWAFLDTIQLLYNADRSITTVFHVSLGYPEWLIRPEHRVLHTNDDGYTYRWWVGDVLPPVYEDSVELGYELWSGLIRDFCDHFTEMGVPMAMTIMAEPNIEDHWMPGDSFSIMDRVDGANRYYKAFVDGVDASIGGEDIKVGGLTWTMGGEVGAYNLGVILPWAQYWKDFCTANDVRRDFVCYHHYWHGADLFDDIADTLASVFPGEPLWLTEWNWHFKQFPSSVQEYVDSVIGMMGATGNLSYLDLALEDTRHEVMTFFCLLGGHGGYGFCHWNDGDLPDSWDYTASGHALRWLARLRGDQLPVTTVDTEVRARAAAGEGEIQVLVWNHSPEPDTVDLALEFGEYREFDYILEGLDSDSTILTQLKKYLNSEPIVDTLVPMPAPWTIEEGREAGTHFTRELAMKGNSIAFLRLGGLATGVEDGLFDFTPGPVWPNPFTSETALEFSLARESDLRLRVFDIRGREVRVISRDGAGPGVQRLAWDGRDARGRRQAQGVYLLRLELDGRRAASRKTLLLK